MEPSSWVALVAAVLGGGVIVVGIAGLAGDRRGRAAFDYLASLDGDGRGPEPASGPDEFARRLARPFTDRIVRPATERVVSLLATVTPSDRRARVRSQLARAGLDTRRRPEEIVAAQVVGLVLGLGLGLALMATGVLSSSLGLLAVILLGVVGGVGPTAWLSRRVEERTVALRADLPETLDLLAISVEAGLGLEGAMQVVIDRGTGPLAVELSRVLQEMSLGLSRRDALMHLRARSLVPELSSFVQALIQADALGMPLSKVLKVQAAEMRSKRRQWARERAGKLPVKILFPLVACIFPAILVVVLGPAVSQIGKAFG